MIAKNFVATVIAFAFCIATANAARAQEGESKPKQDEKATQGEATESSGDDLSAKELFDEAMKAARNNEIDQALELLEKASKMEPENIRYALTFVSGLNFKGMELTNSDRKEASPYFYRAAKQARILLQKDDVPTGAKEMLASVIYNEACSLCLEGKKKEAMSSLKEAFESGLADVQLPAEDEDLADLHQNPEFKKLLKEQAALIIERERIATQTELKEFESYDFDFELKNMDGKTVKLSDFENKVLIVDFWGTWCPPCRAEIPAFVKLKEHYAEKGFDIVGLNYEHQDDEEGTIELVKKFQETVDMNYQCLIGTEEVMEQVPDFEGYPTTLFIDSSGKVRLQLVGQHSYSKLESVVVALMEEEK